jgi:Family of unknown function (DUF6312)
MENPRLSGSINRITVLRQDPSGFTVPVVVYRRGSRGKKGSRTFKAAEKSTRRRAKAQRKTAANYLMRHDKSNRKKKDGWIRDLFVNTVRADSKGIKALKLNRMFSY